MAPGVLASVMFELVFLGTAASAPSAERGLPALLVMGNSRRILVDCGEGTQRQMLRAGVGFRRLERVLLTHRHLDHVLGLGGLIATLGLVRADGELLIHGGRETLAFVRSYLVALWPERLAPIPVGLAAIDAGTTIEGEGFGITCFPVSHRGVESFGFRFDMPQRRHLRSDRLCELGVPEGALRAALARGEAVVLADGRRIEAEDVLGPWRRGASLAVVGDADETGTILEAVRGADALVIEASFLERDSTLARSRGHLTAAAAASLAVEAQIGALYLTHLSERYSRDGVAAEARSLFPNVHVAYDFDRVRVKEAR